MTIRDIFNQSSKFLADNSPALLTGVGVAGTVATAVLTGRASFHASEIIQEEYDLRISDAGSANRALDDGSLPLDVKEKLKLVWPLYIPPVVVGSITIASIITANHVGTRRAAALAAAYSISERSFAEYREKVTERLGESKEQKIRDDIAQDRVNRDPAQNREIIISDRADTLFYESYTGRYFMSTMEDVKKAMNDTNYQMFSENYASLGDFQVRVGLPKTEASEEVGWSIESPVDIEFSGTISDDQRPCIVISYVVAPVRDYFRFR